MIRITDLEQKLVVEQIFGESCGELFKPETFSEWESFESQKQEVYEALWNSEQTFWDIYEMSQRGVFNEANPIGFSDTPTKDAPDIARKQVTISKQMAYLGLPQVPPKAAAGLLANNMVSSNPNYYRYIGKGFFGALQDRENGKQPGNYVKEIRYVLQGKPSSLVIDRETMKPVRRLGAVTNRPIKQGVPQVPPAWNEYSQKKANAFQDEETGQPYHGVYIGYADQIKQLETKIGDRIQLTKGGVRQGTEGGEKMPIYAPERDKNGKVVYGPDGHPKNSSKIVGYVDRSKSVVTKGHGMGRGEIGADLRPPVLDKSLDPNANSYLGTPGDDEDPAVPPGARGYKPQSLSSSNALQRQWGQYKWYMMKYPGMFDQRLIRVLLAKQERDRQNYRRAANKTAYTKQFTQERKGVIPYETRPLQMHSPRTAPYDGKPAGFGMARDYKQVEVPNENDPTKVRNVVKGVDRGYLRRMWHPDPMKPDRQVFASPDKRDMTTDERMHRAQEYLKKVGEFQQELDEIEQEMLDLQQDHKAKNSDHRQDPEWKEMSAERAAIKRAIKIHTSIAQKYEKGSVVVPKPVQTGRFGNQRTPYTPEEAEEILKKGTLNGVPIITNGAPLSNKAKGKYVKRGKLIRDENGKMIQMPTMGAVRQMSLPNNYILSPAPGDPIIVSDNLRQLAAQAAQATDKNQKSKLQSNIMAAAQSGTPDDKVYAMYAEKYGLNIDKNGNVRAKNPKMVSKKAMDTPWTWARTDEKGELMFIYTKDHKEYDIPMYLPGVIDDRKPGNPTAAGGWDAAPANAPEIRPHRDSEKERRSIHGEHDPDTGRIVAGWKDQMIHAANMGVKTGLSTLLKEKFTKQADQFGRTGEQHSMYQALLDAEPEIAHNAFIYFQYNMANSKALDFRQNNTGKLDAQYIKNRFTHLYAALKQFDQWLDKPNATGIPNRGKLGMRLGMSVFDLTFPQLAMILDRLKKYTRNEETGNYRRLFQTKINKNYIKNGLTRFKATDYVKPVQHPNPAMRGEIDPNPPRDRSHYNASGKKVDYNYLDVGYETLVDMFDEARRNYWEFAAKDMVIKMWQHMNTEGGGVNIAGLYGDSLDAALSGRGGGQSRRKGKGGASQDTDAGDIGSDTGEGEPEGEETIDGETGAAGPTRNRLDGSGGGAEAARKRGQQIIGRMTPAQLWDILNKKYQRIEAIDAQLKNDPNNGGVEVAAQQLSLIPAATRTAVEIDVLAELRDEIKAKGWNEDSKQVSEWCAGEFIKRVEMRLDKARQTQKADYGQAGPVQPKNRTPEEFIQAAESEGLDNNQLWSDYATKLLSLRKNQDLEDLMNDFNARLANIPNRDEKAKAERTVAYLVIKNLMAKAGTMTPQEKRKYESLSQAVSTDYKTLYDLTDIIPKILANVPDAPAVAPAAQAGGGLRGRIGRKTG